MARILDSQTLLIIVAAVPVAISAEAILAAVQSGGAMSRGENSLRLFSDLV
jgi:hypothetical protein